MAAARSSFRYRSHRPEYPQPIRMPVARSADANTHFRAICDPCRAPDDRDHDAAVPPIHQGKCSVSFCTAILNVPIEPATARERFRPQSRQSPRWPSDARDLYVSSVREFALEEPSTTPQAGQPAERGVTLSQDRLPALLTFQ